MTDRYRTSSGRLIDRDSPLAFSFDGRRLKGYAGDTLASALLADGTHLMARSFKYHRPRGVLTAGAEEPSALVTVGEGGRATPNLRATQVELFDGLVARSQNNWPRLDFDLQAASNAAARLLPAGFYYKTFMWPANFWPFYERIIRRMAGMGRAPDATDPDRYDKKHHHCDVLVVGAGPAGLAAALAAGRAGARVVIADEGAALGGELLSGDAGIEDASATDWVRNTLEELESLPETKILPRTTIFGYYDDNHLAGLERVGDHLAAPPPGKPRQRLWTIRAREVVLAAGAHERPLVFRDNDRPGIMLAGATRSYLNRQGVRIGERVVVFTGNDGAYRTAIDLAAAGSSVTIVDLRETADGTLATKARSAGVEIVAGHAIVATEGRRRLSAIEIMQLNQSGQAVTGAARRIECDALAMSGGWNPSLHLFSQSGGEILYDAELAAFRPGRPNQSARPVGGANGDFALAACLANGHDAGVEAANKTGYSGNAGNSPKAGGETTEEPARTIWLVPSSTPIGKGGKHFVDFQNDVTAADIELAAREGFQSVEHMKRYTTAGMGTDQGKTGNVNALALLARARGCEIEEVGVTTFRPPYTPITFGALAGRDLGPILADPLRKTPIDAWHELAGAEFELVGQWRRPFYYPKSGEGKWDAVHREIRGVRESVGILDATTLGKIEIEGPDAATLLNWVYTNNWESLKPGRCRYGLMCGEDGMVFDDGVTACLADDRYLMHTTTGNAARVLDWLEEWLQTEWPDLRVYCASATEKYATVNLAGPNARRLLEDLSDGLDLSNEAFPFMSWREGEVAGIPARIFRVSFTGELSYEVNVPASFGRALWTACITAGEKYAITPFGTEALHVLRAEKGYIAVGQDTDGTVTPIDLGMAGLVSKRKDFLGKRSLARADMVVPGRRHLVGLLTGDPEEVLPEGAHIVETVLARPPMTTLGHVTSSYYSPTIGRSIALAMLADGRERIGEPVRMPIEDGRVVSATVTHPIFFDPEGERFRG